MEGTPTPSSSSSGDGTEEPVSLTSLEWSDEEVIAFGDAIFAGGRCLLPIGVNKHFNMISIRHRFQSAIKKNVDTSVLWERLDNSYNMPKLDTLTECPFPNDQSEFSLPESDFNQLIRDRKSQSSPDKLFDEESRDSGSGRETPPTLPIAKRGPLQSSLASSSSKRKYSSSFSETGSEGGGGGTSSGRKSTSGSNAPAGGGPVKVKRRI